MLTGLLAEFRRRHLWPIPLVALLVAVAAPLLFLRSAPPDASPAAAALAPAASAGKLPERAQRLLAAKDAPAEAAARRARKASDPFAAPAASRSAKKAGASSGATAAGGEKAPAPPVVNEPVPVVITNSDGTTPAVSGGAPATRPTTTTAPAPITSSRPAVDVVDVRFGKRIPARLHRAIPRLQTFAAGGRIVAIFVKYSPTRDKAVFAIAPTTRVSGDIECRRKQDLCRYVDIPVGKGVRLSAIGSDGVRVTRRLDVVRITTARAHGAAAAGSAAADDACLLARVLSLGARDAPPATDACPS